MACTQDFIDFVCHQIEGIGEVRSRKMFGDWMVYVNEKPLLLCCDNIVYVKMLSDLDSLMTDAEVGTPYDGARSHYILDIEHTDHARQVVKLLEEVTPLPKRRKK